MSQAPIVPIIGGGPAGMSCALWLHNYGLHPVIIEQERALGGMARRSAYPNDWLLGRPGESARENAAAFAAPHPAGGDRDLARRPAAAASGASDGQFRLDVALSGPQAAQIDVRPGHRDRDRNAIRGEEWLDRSRTRGGVAQAGRLHLGAASSASRAPIRARTSP